MYYRRRLTYMHCSRESIFVRPEQSDKLIGFSGTARRIWEMLDYPITCQEIAHLLAAEYEAQPEEILIETKSFLDSLREKDLLEVIPDKPLTEDRLRYRYLTLLKNALVNLIYPEHEMRLLFLERKQSEMNKLEKARYIRDIRYRDPELYHSLVNAKCDTGISTIAPYLYSHTITGLPALNNIERCAETVFTQKIPGDFLEAGVCQGGTAIFMRALQLCHGEEKRKTWAADSFQGLPDPQSVPDISSGLNFSEPLSPRVAFSLEGVKDNFARYGYLDQGVEFLPGWFADTLPHAKVTQLAILRIDADMYSSTKEVLENLYPRLVKGGFVIIDDYGAFNVCRQAVDEYRQSHNIDEPVCLANRHVAYWRKLK